MFYNTIRLDFTADLNTNNTKLFSATANGLKKLSLVNVKADYEKESNNVYNYVLQFADMFIYICLSNSSGLLWPLTPACPVVAIVAPQSLS